MISWLRFYTRSFNQIELSLQDYNLLNQDGSPKMASENLAVALSVQVNKTP